MVNGEEVIKIKAASINWVDIMKSSFSRVLWGLFFSGLLLPVADAHTFGAEGAGLAEGFAHPFIGLDHLLAMIAVGMWAAQLGGAATWRTPVTFVAAMAGAALLGSQGHELPMLEPAIASSVLALGLLVAFAVRLSTVVGLGLVGLFAIFHGYAHGQELPQTASATLYGAGFLLATGLLHGVGIGVAMLTRQSALVPRLSGSLIAATGLLLLASA